MGAEGIKADKKNLEVPIPRELSALSVMVESVVWKNAGMGRDKCLPDMDVHRPPCHSLGQVTGSTSQRRGALRTGDSCDR